MCEIIIEDVVSCDLHPSNNGNWINFLSWNVQLIIQVALRKVRRILQCYIFQGEGLLPCLNGLIKWTKEKVRLGGDSLGSGESETKEKEWIGGPLLDNRENEDSRSRQDVTTAEQERRTKEK